MTATDGALGCTAVHAALASARALEGQELPILAQHLRDCKHCSPRLEYFLRGNPVSLLRLLFGVAIAEEGSTPGDGHTLLLALHACLTQPLDR